MHSLYPHFICNCGFISFVGTLCFCAIYIHHSFRARIALWLKKNIWYLQLFLFTFIHYFMLQFVNTVCCVILCVILQYIHFLCILFWLFNKITCLFWTYNFGQYSSSIYDNNDITYINKHVFKHFMKFLIRHVNTTLTYLVKKKVTTSQTSTVFPLPPLIVFNCLMNNYLIII